VSGHIVADERLPEVKALAEDIEKKVLHIEAYGEPHDRILRFFRFAHLPPKLQAVSAIYAAAAVLTLDHVPGGVERTVALRKLLEAKDAAVRAAL
jgi:hypothetical protein